MAALRLLGCVIVCPHLCGDCARIVPACRCLTRWQRPNSAPGEARGLVLEELENLLKEGEARLLEQHEMCGIRDEGALLHRRVDQIAHQSLPVLREGPRVVSAGDDQGRHINVGGIPERSPGRWCGR